MNLVERLVVTSQDTIILPSDLPESYQQIISSYSEMNNFEEPLAMTMEKVEKERLEQAKQKFHTTTKIAEALGISQPTVVRKLKKYRIK